jgi:GxxExxY protein
MKYEELSERIIGGAYKVYNDLGFGFLENVYRNAMMIELESMGMKARAEYPISVFYGGKIAGEFAADILVEDKIILELKSVKALSDAHRAQLVNYLCATEFEVGLLINFGEKIDFKRVVFDNERKRKL